MVADKRGGDFFLLLPRVLLEGEASIDGRGVVGLDLLAVGCLLEQVRAEEGGELSKTILPMGGRLPSKGTILEQVSEESSPFLAGLGLADRDVEPFFMGMGRFVTFTFFSQLVGKSPNQLCFLAYATTDLVERSDRGWQK